MGWTWKFGSHVRLSALRTAYPEGSLGYETAAGVAYATNVSRVLRQRIVDFVADYRARVRIVYVEAPAALLLDQNRQRAQAVPARVLDKLIRRWTVPTVREAHTLVLAVADPPAP